MAQHYDIGSHIAEPGPEGTWIITPKTPEPEDPVMDVKQVIVIRRDLGMRRGKEIAQGAHASIAWITSRLAGPMFLRDSGTWQATGYFTDTENQWFTSGSRKICCAVRSEEELLGLVEKARAAGITCELIQDAGKTEFGGVPTYTAAAIGPDTDEKLGPITGDLTLY
jgi:PTH2 family peptidyl-tRNA hydrolase